MKSPEETEIALWLDLVAGLRPLEQLALIGLTEMDPRLLPTAIDRQAVVGEKKCVWATNWLAQRIRPLLYAYCDFCMSFARPIGGSGTHTAELISALASLYVATQGLAIAPAVAFSAWAIQSGLKVWCESFGKIELDGPGELRIEAYGDYGGDFPLPLSETILIPGHCAVEFFPEIREVVRDKSYPDPRHIVRIESPARAEGSFNATDHGRGPTIAEYDQGKHDHFISFSDTRTQRKFSARLDVSHMTVMAARVQFTALNPSLTAA
jgi:hypothetical protein